MGLLSLLMVFLLITVSIALPPDDYFISHESSAHFQSVQLSRWRNFASRAYNQVFSSAPTANSQLSRHIHKNDSENSISRAADSMSSLSLVLEPSPLDERAIRLNEMPSGDFDRLGSRTQSDDLTRFVLASNVVYCHSALRVIHHVRRLCFVEEHDRIFPQLTLVFPPSKKCAESVVASKGLFHIQTVEMTNALLTLDDAQSIV